MQTSTLALIAAIGVLATTSAPLSFGTTPPAIQIADGVGDTVLIDSTGTVTFGGSCTPATCSTTLASAGSGDVVWGGQLGAFTFGHVVGETKPLLTPIPSMDLNFGVSTPTGGTITIMWSDTNFNVPGITSVSMVAGGTETGSTGTLTSYVDNGNALFGPGIPVGTLGPFSTSPFGGSVTGPGPTTTPFSMTEVVTITMGTNSSFGVDDALMGSGGPPPPPSCTLASFIGTYQFNAAGTNVGISSVLVGTLVADGAGHFTTTESSYASGIPGTLLPVPPTTGIINFTDINQGTYQVNSDCTMTLVFHPSLYENPPIVYFPIHWDAFLVKGQVGFFFIATDQGDDFSGAGKKI